jgi:diguanylate cyclase (GGDEF)-like protein
MRSAPAALDSSDVTRVAPASVVDGDSGRRTIAQDPTTMPSESVGQRPLRLLVAERFGWFTRTVATVLDGTGWRVVRASSGARALQFVEETSPDIIVVRDDLDDTDPVELCAELRAVRQVGVVTPIVVVATDVARSQQIAALRAGAWDYTVQPLDAEGFILRLANMARARREVERVTRSTLVDGETGLYNHLGIARRAEEIAADTRRRHAPLSCVVFAAEAASDSGTIADITAQVGAFLRRSGRGSDVVGRLGDLLAVIAPSTSADGAARLAARLRSIIQEMPISGERSHHLRVRAAYCTAADFARSTMSVSEMIQRAQETLRRAPADIDSPLGVVGESVPLAPQG